MIKRLGVMVVILFIVLVSVGAVSAITGAMGNARMILYPEVNGLTYTEIEKSLLIKNVNNESINITLQIDEETGKFIELIDESFILEPKTEKKAQFIVKVKEEGTYKGKIAVFFSGLGKQKAGVALSSEVIVIARKDQGSRGGGGDSGGVGQEDTGGVISDESGEKKSSLTTSGLLIVPVLVLSIILVALMIIMMKKRKKGDKRRKKVNARRKK